MTRRSSLRAQARKIYREMLEAQKEAPSLTLLRKRGREIAERGGGDPPSPSGFGGQAVQNLAEKVRALYEHSAVTVAEIARLAGVTESTIYKYAAKGQWTPRYAWPADASHPRGRRAGERITPHFVPVRGAGGRFIRRADKGKPIVVGLKATDPDGAARAVERCGEAAVLSQQAQRQAEAVRRSEALTHVIEWTGSAFKNLCDFHQRRDKEPSPVDDRLEDILTRLVTMSLAQWEALVAEEERASAEKPEAVQHALRAPDAAQHEAQRSGAPLIRGPA